jgi:hypothetical protein
MLKIFFILAISINGNNCNLEVANGSSIMSRALIDYVQNFYVKFTPILNLFQVTHANNSKIVSDILNEVLMNGNCMTAFQIDFKMNLRESFRKRRRAFNIMLIDSFDSFLKIKNAMNVKLFNYQGYYLIVIVANSDDNFITMMRIFGEMWSNYIINTNIVFMSLKNPKEVVLYTFYPYTSLYCEKVIPIEINKFIDNRWIKSFNYFPEKLHNFYNCTLHVATFSTPPFMIIKNDEKGNVKVDGIDGILLRVLSQKLNFSIQLHISADYWGLLYHNGTVTGAIKMIVDKQANLTLGCFSSVPARDAVMKSSSVYYFTNLVWIVPPGKPQSAIEKLANPLEISIWLWTLASTIIGFTTIFFIKRSPKEVQDFVFGNNIQSPAMNLINVIFGGSLHKLPKRNFSRFFLALFILYCFIIRSSYSGNLVKFMQMDTRGKRVQSMAEMIDKDFKFFMLPSARNYVLDYPDVLQRTHILGYSDFNDAVEKMTNDPYFNGVFLTSSGHLIYRNMKLFPKQFIHHAPEALLTLNIVIYYHHESCLTTPFDRQVRNLFDSGFIEYWAENLINRKYSKEIKSDGNQILSLNQLIGAFHLLIGGWMVAFVVFWGEIILKMYSCKRA